MDQIDGALQAALACIEEDASDAEHHLEAARQHSRAAARRHRQLVEIASLAIAGAYDRADGLALVHAADFPHDAALLALIARNVPHQR